MKRKIKFIIIACLIICLCIYLSTVVIIKKAIIRPISIEPDMYVVYYDYYADCWSIIDGYNINADKINIMKIINGSDPKNELSIDIWSCNSFIVYGTIQKIEEDDFCNIYAIHCTHWNIFVQNGVGIVRKNINCRPKEDKGLTIYDYKWFDFIIQPDELYSE